MAPETKELARLEALAEAAYDRMYDTPPLRSVKDAYEDACMYFYQAIEEAKCLGLASEVERLAKRSEHVRAVYNNQFRI